MPSQWADQPYSLISTEAFSKDLSHDAYYAATQMALAHNGMIRGLNSIYLQATAIPHNDTETVRDFLTYCQCWCESIHHHHDVEEETFFPSIEKLSNQPGLMQQNVEQHATFAPGFEAFHEHVKHCPSAQYDGKMVKHLVEAFAEPLTKHLREEIDTLRALDKYDSTQVRKAYDHFDKLMRNTDNVRMLPWPLDALEMLTDSQQRIAPLVFGTADRTFEGGRHDFPAVPFFVPYIIHYAFERKHHGAWRFNPCTTWRDPRELAFVPENLE